MKSYIEKQICKTRQSSTASFNFLRPHPDVLQKGFTLIEILVALSIMALVVMTTAAMLLRTLGENQKISHRSGSLYHMMRAHYGLITHLNQAINIYNHAPRSKATYGGSSYQWFIAPYDSDSERVVTDKNQKARSQNIDLLAVFKMEGALSRDNPDRTQLNSAAIFFQRATPTTSGVLYISRVPASSSNRQVHLRPFRDKSLATTVDNRSNLDRQEGFFYPALTRVQISNLQTVPHTYTQDLSKVPPPLLSGLKITLWGRNFLTDKQENYRWCSPELTKNNTPCQGGEPHKDVSRSVNIVFRNNLVFADPSVYTLEPSNYFENFVPDTNSPTGWSCPQDKLCGLYHFHPSSPTNYSEERILGPIYFFNFSPPRRIL